MTIYAEDALHQLERRETCLDALRQSDAICVHATYVILDGTPRLYGEITAELARPHDAGFITVPLVDPRLGEARLRRSSIELIFRNCAFVAGPGTYTWNMRDDAVYRTGEARLQLHLTPFGMGGRELVGPPPASRKRIAHLWQELADLLPADSPGLAEVEVGVIERTPGVYSVDNESTQRMYRTLYPSYRTPDYEISDALVAKLRVLQEAMVAYFVVRHPNVALSDGHVLRLAMSPDGFKISLDTPDANVSVVRYLGAA